MVTAHDFIQQKHVFLERYGDKDDPEREKTSNCMVFKTAIFSHNRFKF